MQIDRCAPVYIIHIQMFTQHHWLNGHESEQTPGEGKDRWAWLAVVHGVTKCWARLSNRITTIIYKKELAHTIMEAKKSRIRHLQAGGLGEPGRPLICPSPKAWEQGANRVSLDLGQTSRVQLCSRTEEDRFSLPPTSALLGPSLDRLDETYPGLLLSPVVQFRCETHRHTQKQFWPRTWDPYGLTQDVNHLRGPCSSPARLSPWPALSHL